MDEERDNSSLTEEELKRKELSEWTADEYPLLVVDNAKLKIEKAELVEKIKELAEKTRELARKNAELETANCDKADQLNSLMKSIESIPFLGKIMMVRFKTMLPPANIQKQESIENYADSIGVIDEERDNSSLTAEKLKIEDLSEWAADYPLLVKENVTLQLEKAKLEEKIATLVKKNETLAAQKSELENANRDKSNQLNSLMSSIEKIPFLGKRIMARFKTMLPPANTQKQEGKYNDKEEFKSRIKYEPIIPQIAENRTGKTARERINKKNKEIAD